MSSQTPLPQITDSYDFPIYKRNNSITSYEEVNLIYPTLIGIHTCRFGDEFTYDEEKVNIITREADIILLSYYSKYELGLYTTMWWQKSWESAADYPYYMDTWLRLNIHEDILNKMDETSIILFREMPMAEDLVRKHLNLPRSADKVYISDYNSGHLSNTSRF